MDEITRQWLCSAIFSLTIIAAMAVEVVWLGRRTTTPDGRSIAYVVLTDVLSLGISFGAILVFMLMLLMLVFGPDGLGTAGYDALMWVIVVLAFIFPPVIFVVIKRVFIYFLGLTGLSRPWAYSAASSLLLLAATPLPAVLVYYLLGFAR